MYIVRDICDQIQRIEEHGGQLDREILSVKSIQDGLMVDMDNAETYFTQTADKINTTYPELSRNEELARQLQPDSVHDMFPDSVPPWARSYLVQLSHWVRLLADFILMVSSFYTWLADRLPPRARSLLYSALLVGVKGIWACMVITYQVLAFIGRLLSEVQVRQAIAAVFSPFRTHPWPAAGVVAATWFAYFYALDREIMSSFAVRHVNS